MNKNSNTIKSGKIVMFKISIADNQNNTLKIQNTKYKIQYTIHNTQYTEL
jgi:hypothetical protein